MSLKDNNTLYTATKKVRCDGPKSGKHPRVYLTIGKNNKTTCPYCSQHFKKEKKPLLK